MSETDMPPAPGPQAAEHPVLLAIDGLTKQFPGTLALDAVDFDVRVGEIHALVGENGAGKSTLIKILAGVYPTDDGHITLHGEPYEPSKQHSIAFIHQDLGLFPTYSVAENIALVAGYARPHGLISWPLVRKRATEILASMGADIDVEEPVAALTSAERSIVAIARAISLDAEVLVLDEPTASLPETDVRKLFETLDGLRRGGIGIVFVSHRLDEVFRLADRVTILRDGKRIETSEVSQTTPAQLVAAIVGRELSDMFIEPQPAGADVVLELDEFEVGTIGPVSLRLNRGEILGLVGLRGAGQDLIGRSVFGDTGDLAMQGSMRVLEKPLRAKTPNDAMGVGVAFVSSKRTEEGVAGSLTVRENIYPNAAMQGKSIVSRLRPKEERSRVRAVMDRFDVRPRDPEREIGTLSGGNQQKSILARWLEAESGLLILEEPTFGVDVGARAEIYRILAKYVSDGNAVLLVSSDFEEVAGISNRALVFRRGKVVAEVQRDDLSVIRLTELATGATDADLAAVIG